MNCHDCEVLLQRRLDGESIGDAPALEQHLSDCAACRARHAGAQRLLAGLQQMSKSALPADFAERVVAEVLGDRRRRQVAARRRLSITVGLAASVMVMLAAAYFWLPREQAPVQQQMVNKHRTRKPDAPPTEKPAEPLQLLTALTDRVADATRDHAKVVIVAANLDGVDKLPVNDLPIIEPGLREAGQEVSDGLRTVTNSARRALDFFAREIPMPEMPEAKN